LDVDGVADRNYQIFAFSSIPAKIWLVVRLAGYSSHVFRKGPKTKVKVDCERTGRTQGGEVDGLSYRESWMRFPIMALFCAGVRC